MRAYAAGSVQALAQIFDRYAPVLLGVFSRRLATAEDARDLVQQTFLQLHRARADFDQSQRLRPWLFTIAFNLQREYFRSKRRLAETELTDLDIPVQPALVGRTEAAVDIERALPKLLPDQRDVVELHWLADLSFPEIAEVLGATVGSTRVRAHRAYARLRVLLSEDASSAAPRNTPRTGAV